MRRQVGDDILAWTDRLRTDRSPATRAAFEAWLERDPARRHEYEQMTRLDGLLRQAGVRPEPVARRPWRPVLLIGATAALILAIGLPRLGPADRPVLGSAAQAQLTHPLRLADGTIVILSGAGHLQPTITRRERRVALHRGSARFIVADQGTRALVVEGPGVRAIATAGVFDLDIAADGTRVTAVKGEVAVQSIADGDTGEPSLIAARQRIDLPTMMVSTIAADERVQMIEADGLALGDVVRIANEADGPHLALSDAGLAERRVTGRFSVVDHKGLARRLAAALGLAVSDLGDRLLLSPDQK